MFRFLALLLAIAVPDVAWSQASSGPRNITRERQQIFASLADQAPTTNAGMFVGVNKFTQDRGLNELAYAVHDAIETAYLFAFEVKLIRPDHCHLLLSGTPENKIVQQHLDQLQQQGATIGSANRTEILRTFVRVSRLANKDTDLLVCSFSSHGFEDRGDAYVMPADGFRDLLADTAVPLKTVERNMAFSKAGHRLLLVDACQERVSARSSSQAGDPAGDSLIAALQQPSGQAKLASCSSGEFSYENSSLGGVGHGVFTWALLEALRGGATADAENLVRLGSVAEYVAGRVTAWTKENQRKPQSPFLKSPVATRNLPLAAKADDLTTLLASLQRQPASGGFTVAMRDDLVEYLGKLDASNPEDRELLSATREFLSGKLRANFFIAYVERDRLRWGGAHMERPETGSLRMKVTEAGEVRTFNEKLDLEMVWCPPGQFTMGSPNSEKDRGDDEDQVEVTLTNGFWLGRTEVTQGQWKSVMGTEPWKGQSYVREDPDYPATYVSWEDAVKFCEVLTKRDSPAGRLPQGLVYQLPTEAQWEYACRAGTKSSYSFGDDASSVGEYAWFGGNAWEIDERYAHRVGTKRENAWHLYDMHGNVWEWCRDWYQEKLSGGRDPFVSAVGSDRVNRGGSWFDSPLSCRSADRDWFTPADRSDGLGFRVSSSVQ